MATETWSRLNQTWRHLDLERNQLTESDIGWDHPTLYFPGVSSCTAVAMWVDNITVLGAHFDKVLTTNDVDSMLNRMLTKVAGLTIGNLFVFGALGYPSGNQSFVNAPKFQRNQLMLTLAKFFKITGLVCFYDQYDYNSPSTRQPAKHYRAVSVPNGVMTLSYCDVARNAHGGDATFDKHRVTWENVPISPLRELY